MTTAPGVATATGLTLADVALPGSTLSGSTGVWRDAALVVSASLLTAVCAQIAIPMGPVPITAQSFAVLLTGAALGWKRGMLAQCLYLAQGMAGLPVMAQGLTGLQMIVGPSAGYAVAFPLAAGLTGYLAEKGWDRRVSTMMLSMVLGMTVIYTLGMLGLLRFVEAGKVFAVGVLPYLLGDALKVVLAGALFPAAWRICRGK